MKYLFLIFSFLLIPLGSQALGVAVSPSSLEMFYPDKQDKYLNIRNISEEPVAVFIQADNFIENLSVYPTELRLLPDEVGQVSIGGSFKDDEPGIKHTNISVISKAIDKRSFNAASGLKIPLTIYINESFFKWSGEAVFVAAFVGLLFIALIVQLIFYLFRFKQKKKSWLSVNLLKHHKKRGKIF